MIFRTTKNGEQFGVDHSATWNVNRHEESSFVYTARIAGVTVAERTPAEPLQRTEPLHTPHPNPLPQGEREPNKVKRGDTSPARLNKSSPGKAFPGLLRRETCDGRAAN